MSSPPPRVSATADDELAAAIGGDRLLSLQHSKPEHRPALEALWRVDAAMGDVVARATEPMLGRIKLAWWREELEKLDHHPPPPEPRLRAVAASLLPLGISGRDLAAIEPGWATLLDEPADPQLIAERGRHLFGIAAKIIGQDDEKMSESGAFWALASTARRGLPELIGPAREALLIITGHRFDRGVRSITLLARLAARDLGGPPFEPEASRRRALAALAHRWSGRIF
jgi:15-cis-phytoene synthase